jgi:hypothetical protein
MIDVKFFEAEQHPIDLRHEVFWRLERQNLLFRLPSSVFSFAL